MLNPFKICPQIHEFLTTTVINYVKDVHTMMKLSRQKKKDAEGQFVQIKAGPSNIQGDKSICFT